MIQVFPDLSKPGVSKTQIHSNATFTFKNVPRAAD
jgi:hypothetical protein